MKRLGSVELSHLLLLQYCRIIVREEVHPLSQSHSRFVPSKPL